MHHSSSTSKYNYANPPRKTAGRTVIAHISDLHFTSTTNADAEEWKALKSDLSSQKIDFIAVTGDLIDNSLWDSFKDQGVNQAFDNVLKFLKSLCASNDIDPEIGLGVVPGNHDHRIKGVFHSRSSRDDFYKKFANYYRPKLLPSLRCSVFTFDSNTVDPRINFASGRINNDDIIEFSDSIRAMVEDYPRQFASCTKVVLVHHHPMPIAATELTPNFINSDEYHLLKNAGLFMTEMVRQKTDLILHGHKHYAALSKAIFPLQGEEDHTIAIVAAGSVSGRGEPFSSYNVVTIEDSGEIYLARKIRELASYGKPALITRLHSYEATRQIRLPKLATLMNAQLKCEKYTRVTTIQQGSGDVLNRELYGNVRSYTDEEVPVIDQRYSSASGWSGDPAFKYDDIRVTWEWVDKSKGKGKMRFDPPIKNSLVSFEVATETHNALHFNKQDRLIVTGTDSDESIKSKIREVYDLLVIKLSFPMSFSPLHIWLEVDDEQNNPDRAEQRYAAPRLTQFDDDNSILFVLDKPLPGYTYKIVWELPDTESEQLHLRESDRKFAEEIHERLLALRTEGDKYRLNQVEQRLHNLKAEINTGIGPMPIGADDLEISIHCFDPELGRLVYVAFIGTAPPSTPLMIGSTIIGQAYKRREVVALSPKRLIDGRDPYDYDDGHSGVLSIPLLYPFDEGLRVGVITLATRSKTASFLRLLDADLPVEDESAFHVLVDEVLEWYGNSLIPALDLRI